MLEVRALAAGYGRAQVLFGFDLALRAGELVALLGRNGAGKSTTLKALMGLVPPAAGEVHFRGERIDRLAPWRIARLGLAYVPEERRIFTDLSVTENLEVGRLPRREGAVHWTAQRLFELFPNLGRMRDRRGGSMSGGEQQMLSIARSLMGNPLALLLDEPSEGLAPVIVDAMAGAVLELKREGLCVLLTEQNLRFARRVADRACILETGQLRHQGAMSALDADPALRERYLAA
ncbi:MAG: ABC transporter ATP-binding protein [Betaproteobacteria bacterium]|nr:ABC transporter ATP-binding protein [Betaproteobacteria bacterium]